MDTSTPGRPAGVFYLDDLRVGQRFASGTHEVDAQQIVAFARQFDPQPFHLSDEGARHSLFGSLAASGWHTASITMRLIADSHVLAGGVIGVGADVTWPRATRPGDVLRVEGEVLEIIPSRSRPDRGIVVIRNETLNQRGEAVQVMVAKLMVPRRPAADSARAEGRP